MGAKRTRTLAYEFVEHIEGFLKKGTEFMTGFSVQPEDLSATREIVMKELRRRGYCGMVSTTYSENSKTLWVGKKKLNREQRLVEMIKKLMAGCENEKLYEEAHNLLYGGNGG